MGKVTQMNDAKDFVFAQGEGYCIGEKKVFLRESQNAASVIELTGSPGNAYMAQTLR